MRIDALRLGLAAAAVTVVGFGACALFFAVAPVNAAAFVSWLLHLDITGLARPVSVPGIIASVVLFGAYVGVLVGATARIYNRM